jgi:hypothetical protein
LPVPVYTAPEGLDPAPLAKALQADVKPDANGKPTLTYNAILERALARRRAEADA